MLVQVSKKMVNELNKAAARPAGVTFYYTEFSVDAFRAYVDFDLWDHENDLKFDKEGRNVFKVISATYDPEYYAMPQYLTTNDLLRIYKRSNKTFDGFISAVYEEVGI